MTKRLKKSIAFLLSITMIMTMLLNGTFVLTASAEGESSATGVTFEVVSGSPAGFTNEGYANLVDNDTSTKWCCVILSPADVVIKASEPISVSGYTITTANDTATNSDRNPKTWTLSASNDNATWVEIDKIDNGNLPAENFKAVTFPVTNVTEKYQYFRLYITQLVGGNTMQISEFAITYTTCEHQWEKTGETIDPTCTEGGYDVYKCSNCEAEKNVPNDNPATGHEKGEDGKCTKCGTYMISDADELKTFAAAVNGGEWSANAVLTANITVNNAVFDENGNLNDGLESWTPIGSRKYTGTFDGQEHTISGLYFSDTDTSIFGLFGYVEDGSISNVGVVDSYFSGKQHIGGICGSNNGGTITNCYNEGTVNGASYVGGICGTNKGPITNCRNTGVVSGEKSSVGGVCGYNQNGTVTNCYNTGAVSGSSWIGGVCGYSNAAITNCHNTGVVCGTGSSVGGVCGNNSGGTITNCYNTGVVSETGSSVGGVCGNNSGTITNCYYLAESETDSIDGTTFKTAEGFAGGEVAYLLSQGTNGDVWGQDLSKENTYPVLDSTKKVYRNNAYSGCGGSPDAPLYSYANEKIDPDYTEHKYKNGFCTACGAYEPATDTDDDGCYEIGNAGQLFWFANKVNNDNANYKNANAVLTADIVVNADVLDESGNVADDTSGFRIWTPIGWYDFKTYTSYSYNGTFDGQKHTVSGLYFNDESADDVGLFGYVGENGSISNVGIVDSYFKGDEFVGGVCGDSYGTIINCYNTGVLSGNDFVGGVCGYNIGTIENCYNTASVTGSESGTYIGGVYGDNDDGTITNCYYLGDTATAGIGSGSVSSKTVAQFANGEVAYLLSQGTNDDVWGQDLSKDSYPVLGGAKVYRIYQGCTGTPGDPQAYSNENKDAVNKQHSYNKGFCTICGDYEPATDSDDDGYYEIGNAGQLYWFAVQVNCGNNGINAVLTTDITVNEGVLNANGELNSGSFRAWTPIGSVTNPYIGTFDGQGRTISGLCFNDESTKNVGLFGYVGENGSVSNVGVLDSYFVGNESVGGVCGYNKGTINGCYAICAADAMDYYVGGVCGYNEGTITNCCSNNINPSRSAAIGYDESDSTANVSAKSTAQFASGEVAYLLNGSTSEGSLVWGQTLGSEGANAYPITHTDTNTVYATTGCVTYNNDGNTSAQEHHYDNGKCTVCGKYTEPKKDENGVYQISNATELYWFADTVNSGNGSVNAVLTNDITVNKDVLKDDGTLADDVSGFTSWTPIGYYNSDSDYSFYTGRFDGAGHTISGLYLNDRDTFFDGLFGFVGEGGAVLNVGVVDSYFKGENYAGGVCGANESGTITNCYNTGAVTVTGENGYAGGVCGVNYGGTITNCYNTGTVTATNEYSYVGGVCGQNDGTITNCYNTGTVTMTGENGYAGGVCGVISWNGTITNCYYLATEETDEIDGTTFKNAEQFASGEVCYLLNGGKTSGQVWYQNIGEETADKSPVLDSSHGIVYLSLCTGDYSNENIGHTVIGDYDSNGFGVCSVCDADICQPATQNESGIFEIYNAGQLYWFAEQVNIGNSLINAVLKNDITVNADVLKDDGTLADDVSGFMAWTPIGNYDNNQYNGTFDGAGYTISGLYFDDTSAYDVGLFGCVGENGVVSNVGVADSYINADEYIGGICGENYGEVINCNNSGVLSGTSYVGGVCGYNDSGTIEKCNNEGTVNGSDDVGGVCGYNDGGTIKNCSNEGTVNGTDDIGGVCGYSNGTIDNCSNTGTVNGDSESDDVGGVCGTNRGTIKNCNNKGSVSGADFVGGVCGYNWGGTIENCNNEGVLSGTNWVGGVCGKNNSKGEIKDCHNEGELSGTGNNIGGICGSNDGTMTNCYNTVSVSGTVTESNAYIYVGGVCGYNDSGTITSCYNTGDVTAANYYAYVGGVSGNNEGTITNCYNKGSVSGTIDAGGVSGYNWGGIVTNCYNIGTVTAKNDDAYVGGVCGNNYDGTIANCYYLAAEETDEIDGTTFKTTSQFNSGEVAYLLSQGCTIGEGEDAVTYDGSIWGQTIGTDKYPVLGDAKVYKIAYKNGDAEYEADYANAGEFELPVSSLKGFVAYSDNTDYLFAGQKVQIESDTSFSIVTLTINMTNGASMRMHDITGIRFYSQIDTDLITALRNAAKNAGATLSLGTMISKKSIIGEQDFTKDMSGQLVDVRYEAKTWYSEDEFTGMVGSIVNIKESNYNEEFVGRGYVTVTYGDVSTTVYADYDGDSISNNSRSICYIANQIMLDQAEYEALSAEKQQIVKDFADKYTGEDKYNQ